MPASVIPDNGQQYVAGDYETRSADRLYDMSGPKCNGRLGQPGCGKPYKQCTCPKTATLENLGDPFGDTPQDKQTNALVMIAGYLGEILKHLKNQKAPEAVSAPAVPEIDPATLGLVVASPDVPAMPPAIDPEKLARNEAKKTETLERLKGAK